LTRHLLRKVLLEMIALSLGGGRLWSISSTAANWLKVLVVQIFGATALILFLLMSGL